MLNEELEVLLDKRVKKQNGVKWSFIGWKWIRWR
jgi:hypothetical protein